MSLQKKTTLKSLEKMMMIGEVVDLFNEIRMLEEELTTKKKKVSVLEDSVSFISNRFEKVMNEYKKIKNQIEVLKADNSRLTKKMFVMEENDKQANIKLNQIERKQY